MRGLINLFTHFSVPRASRWLIATSMALLTVWLQAHLLLAAVHDDGSTVRNAIAVYNSPEARGQVTGVVDWAFAQGTTLAGGGAEVDALQTALVGALGAGRISAPVAAALESALLGLRDDALEQFAADGPTAPLSLRLQPLLKALDVPITPQALAELGLPATADLAVPILDAGTVASLRTKYHWAELANTWGLLAAAVLGLAGVFLAPRPLRTIAIVVGLGGAACLVAIPLFGVLHDWLIGGGAGPWSPLVSPLVDGAMNELRPWLLPIGIAGVAVGALSLAGLIYQERRKTVAHGGGEVATHTETAASVVARAPSAEAAGATPAEVPPVPALVSAQPSDAVAAAAPPTGTDPAI